jgi:maltose O-acetyltransferase
MSELLRMLSGNFYRGAFDSELQAMHKKACSLCKKFNESEADYEIRISILRELFGSIGDNAWIEPNIHCDYGTNIHIGHSFYANFNCIFLDVNTINIGDRVFLAPDVKLFTAGHPIDPITRGELYEFGKPITIGNDVWIGGGTIINPGVTIEDRCVIGSGSVVTKNIPKDSIAVGNPCRVIRKISDKDLEEARILKQIYTESKSHDNN